MKSFVSIVVILALVGSSYSQNFCLFEGIDYTTINYPSGFKNIGAPVLIFNPCTASTFCGTGISSCLKVSTGVSPRGYLNTTTFIDTGSSIQIHQTAGQCATNTSQIYKTIIELECNPRLDYNMHPYLSKGCVDDPSTCTMTCQIDTNLICDIYPKDNPDCTLPQSFYSPNCNAPIDHVFEGIDYAVLHKPEGYGYQCCQGNENFFFNIAGPSPNCDCLGLGNNSGVCYSNLPGPWRTTGVFSDTTVSFSSNVNGTQLIYTGGSCGTGEYQTIFNLNCDETLGNTTVVDSCLWDADNELCSYYCDIRSGLICPPQHHQGGW